MPRKGIKVVRELNWDIQGYKTLPRSRVIRKKSMKKLNHFFNPKEGESARSIKRKANRDKKEK
jgi:hypothetical protein